MSAKQAGNAPLDLVVLSGWGSDPSIFDGFLSRWSSSFRITKIDYQSVPLPSGNESIKDLKLHLIDALLEQVPQKAILLGWSLGGLVASWIADRLQAKALITLGWNPCFVQKVGWHPAMPQDVFQVFSSDFKANVRQMQMRFIALQSQGSVQASKERKALLANRKDYLDAQALEQSLQYLGLLASDARSELVQLNCPSLLLYSEHDALVPLEIMSEVSPLNLQSTVGLIEGSAHLPFISEPEQVNRYLYDFLRQQNLVAEEDV
ncbi:MULTISPECIES: alpha/beta fold hydrolase [Nitrincola]|uniref:Pimelyl-[acyl-carrier protein] methyl ester esterase n=1 Tax=Nitrincola nitratireducens TaxID=1229521 RepID=W9V3W3_9GAMM|nr:MULTISPECIES: alpha/beta fold hydrolase [Nitrincola]EXJ11631.1 Pimelyl-[acyl-carrier protein] methyl ester esterase [Nitrincola nitratireducens]